MLRLFALVVFAFCLGVTASAHAITPPETTAREAFMIDDTTGAVLYAKNADVRMPTSSMSKVMTMIVVFDALRSGKISLEQELPVSETAWRMQGSKMFVDLNSSIKVEDLIRGVIIQSGNDACIVLAEGIAGSEENFAALMNSRAKEIGMTNSNFMNASGWPDPNHYSTAHDLALMARYLIDNYPQEYKYYSEREFTFNNIKQGNRNPLLYSYPGADGVKTGHTEEAGYGLIGSAVANGRRVIMVINGTESMQARADEARKLMDWALKSFRNVQVTKKDDPVTDAPVVLGQEKSVTLVADRDVVMTLPSVGQMDIKMQAVFPAPLVAPVAKGTKVGKLVITIPNMPQQEIPLVTASDVAEKSFFERTMEKFMIRLVGVPKYQ
jgi:serine-type D-Ala-D-Ala carboxypeptidase (penicillin-binding protein 5/6)